MVTFQNKVPHILSVDRMKWETDSQTPPVCADWCENTHTNRNIHMHIRITSDFIIEEQGRLMFECDSPCPCFSTIMNKCRNTNKTPQYNELHVVATQSRMLEIWFHQMQMWQSSLSSYQSHSTTWCWRDNINTQTCTCISTWIKFIHLKSKTEKQNQIHTCIFFNVSCQAQPLWLKL